MEIYTYSEARQKLASVLDKAEASGKVLIRRKDGSTFALTPERAQRSPLDVPSTGQTSPLGKSLKLSGKRGVEQEGGREAPDPARLIPLRLRVSPPTIGPVGGSIP